MPRLELPSDQELQKAALETARTIRSSIALTAECLSRMEGEALVLLSERGIDVGADRINLIGLLAILSASVALAESTRHAIELAFAKSEIPIAEQLEYMRSSQVVAASVGLNTKLRNFNVHCQVRMDGD